MGAIHFYLNGVRIDRCPHNLPEFLAAATEVAEAVTVAEVGDAVMQGNFGGIVGYYPAGAERDSVAPAA
jgi:hypothetical protein